MTPAVTSYKQLREALEYAEAQVQYGADAFERRVFGTISRVMEFSCQMAWAKLSQDEKRASGYAA